VPPTQHFVAAHSIMHSFTLKVLGGRFCSR
jgi:hypothetical protein